LKKILERGFFCWGAGAWRRSREVGSVSEANDAVRRSLADEERSDEQSRAGRTNLL